MNRISSTLPSDSEIEAVLVVREDAEEVLMRLAGLTRILNYRLVSKPSRTIHDTYYDTPNKSLERRSINLRTRQIEEDILISVKSGPRFTWGGIKRREVELPWSQPNLARTLKALKLNLEKTELGAFEKGPVEVLTGIGLEISQDRQTIREARDIEPVSDTSRSALAELDLDRVTYKFEDKTVSFCEIEVESKTKNSVMREVTRELLVNHKPTLQRWNHGKFVTGKAIEKLLKRGDLPELPDGALLTGKELDRIDRFIRSGMT